MKKTRLTKKQKTDWLNALQSGEYKQGTGKLALLNGSYCCLGVLAIVHPDLNLEKCKTSYQPFFEIIDATVINALWNKNDQNRSLINGDFSNVIPMIEKLETID